LRSTKNAAGSTPVNKKNPSRTIEEHEDRLGEVCLDVVHAAPGSPTTGGASSRSRRCSAAPVNAAPLICGAPVIRSEDGDAICALRRRSAGRRRGEGVDARRTSGLDTFDDAGSSNCWRPAVAVASVPLADVALR